MQAIVHLLKKPVLSNTLSVVILRGITTLTRLTLLFITARYAVPALFGMLIFALTVAEIARVVADFGLDMYVVREFAMKPGDEHPAIAAAALLAKLGCTLLIYAASCGYLWLTQAPTQAALGSVACLLIISTLTLNLPIGYFQGRLRTSVALPAIMLTNVGAIGALIVAMWFRPGVTTGLAILLIADAVNALALLWLLHHSIGPLPMPAWAAVWRLLRGSLPIAGLALVVTIYTRLDVVVLNTFFDSAVVGYYGLAFRLTEPFQLIAVAFATSIYTYVSSLIASDKPVRPTALRYLVGVLGYGLFSSMVIAVIAPLAIAAFLPTYLPAVPVLHLLAVALVFRNLNTCLSAIIQAYGRFVWLTYVSIWNLILVGLTLFLLVPTMGAAGAALALLVGEGVNSLIQAWLAWQVVHRRPSAQPSNSLAEPAIGGPAR